MRATRVEPDRWEDWEPSYDRRSIDVVVTENPELAVLYGPKGEPLRVLRERHRVPFGFVVECKERR